MIPEFTAAITAVTALGEAAKTVGGILQTNSDFKAKEVITNLQNGVLELQAKVYAAQAKYHELEQKLAVYEKWDSEASRYRLTELAPGIAVYALQPDQANGEPIHYICPNCFQNRKKSILHRPAVDRTNYVCDACEFDARPVETRLPMPSTVRMRLNRFDGL